MQKIPSVFQRNYETDRLCRDEVVPGCEWVLAGEGVATRKFDGTCCLVRDGRLYKRYEARVRLLPDSYVRDEGLGWEYVSKLPVGFEPATEPDFASGKQQGWVPVSDGSEDRWHREAFESGMGVTGRKEILFESVPIEDGTWELIGPKVQGNPEQCPKHLLVKHGACPRPDCPRTFVGLREWFKDKDIEGIVFHHPDGRMAKVKKKDFGLKRKPGAN